MTAREIWQQRQAYIAQQARASSRQRGYHRRLRRRARKSSRRRRPQR